MPAIKTTQAPVFLALLEEAQASISRSERAASPLMELEVCAELSTLESYDDGPFQNEEVRSSPSLKVIDFEEDTLV